MMVDITDWIVLLVIGSIVGIFFLIFAIYKIYETIEFGDTGDLKLSIILGVLALISLTCCPISGGVKLSEIYNESWCVTKYAEIN